MTEERMKELRELSECDLSLPRPKHSTIQAANALSECLDEIDRLRSALRVAMQRWAHNGPWNGDRISVQLQNEVPEAFDSRGMSMTSPEWLDRNDTDWAACVAALDGKEKP